MTHPWLVLCLIWAGINIAAAILYALIVIRRLHHDHAYWADRNTPPTTHEEETRTC